MKYLTVFALCALSFLSASFAQARVVRLNVQTQELILNGKAFGLAGAYEKLSGTVDIALHPENPANALVVDLELAPRNEKGEVEFSADFYLLKPVDPARGNGVVFYEAGNRGTKRILQMFQKGTRSQDPKAPEDFGNGALMEQGFSLLWMGWQWDVPEGRMRMEMPIATQGGETIYGLVRGNFIGGHSETALVADRGHRAYAPVDTSESEQVMTVRSLPTDKAEIIPRQRWRFVDSGTVTLDGGFEPGRIYDVVYRSQDPKVVGTGLAGTRDIVSFFKYERSDANPLPGIRYAIGWGVSQTGRFLRHLLYQGFNADEQGRIVFDGVIDQVGGGGRGSFNHRFGQASRDALQHYNILFPVDMFPFTDGPETDPETGETDSLLRRARESNTVPKVFHILTNSEFFNRAGSLVLTDPVASRDTEVPESTRIYSIASAPHIVGSFPPEPYSNPAFLSQAPMNPLVYTGVIRAAFNNMVKWVVEDVAPPANTHPRLADGTLVTPARAGWPNVPGVELPKQPLTAYRLDYGPRWDEGIVSYTPPRIGKPFAMRVPSVDDNGNDRAGIRLPAIEVPLGTHTGWNYRHPDIGAPDRLSSEIGAYFAFAKTRDERIATGDSRLSVEERYRDRDDYIGKVTRAALELVDKRFLLVEDLPEIIVSAETHYEWTIGR